MSKISNGNYYTVYHWMTNELGLKGVTRDVYAMIYSYCKSGNEFKGSWDYLANFIGANRRTIARALSELVKKDLIIKTIKNQHFVSYKINVLKIADLPNADKFSLIESQEKRGKKEERPKRKPSYNLEEIKRRAYYNTEI